MAYPNWLKTALTYIGTKEIKGRKHNPVILGWWKKIKVNWVKTDEVPNCAAFIGNCFEEVGIRSTRSGRAQSYAKSPHFKKIKAPVVGCVVVFERGAKGSGKGHVIFGMGRDKRGRIVGVGANHSDTTSIKPFKTSRVIGYYWPVVEKIKDYSFPLVKDYGKASTNER